MTVGQLKTRIEETIQTAAQADEWLRAHPPVVTYDGFQTNGVILDDHAELVTVLREANAAVLGTEIQGQIATAVNDMRYYIFEGVPATCNGAAGGNAHAADEWLDLASMAPAAKVLAKFIVDWCGVEE